MIKMKREVKIGLFAVLTLLALYWGINFLKGRDLFNQNMTYYASYDQVNGVQGSSAVFIQGVKVGAVTDIIFDPTRSDKVILELNIKSKYRIPDNSEALIFSDGVLGGKALEIRMGNSSTYLENGDTLHSAVDKGFLEVAGSEFEGMKQKATVLMNNINTTLESLNKVLADNSANINETVSNLAGISGVLEEVMLDGKKDLRGIIQNIHLLTATLEDNASKVDRIIANVEGFSDSLNRSNVPQLVNELTVTASELNAVIGKINSGEGSLGRLMQDDALYDSLVTASGNLARLLEDVKENPGRYIHISVFGGGRDKEKK